jgi:hypothetical protein
MKIFRGPIKERVCHIENFLVACSLLLNVDGLLLVTIPVVSVGAPCKFHLILDSLGAHTKYVGAQCGSV